MKTTRKLIIGTLLGATLVAGVTAVAHQGKRFWHDHDPQQRAEWMIERVSDKLDLDAEQTGKLTVLVEEMQTLKRALQANREVLRDDLLALVSAEQLDQQALIDIVTEKTGLINSSAPRIIAALADFSNHLDPGQKARLQQFMQHRIGHQHHWQGHDDANE